MLQKRVLESRADSDRPGSPAAEEERSASQSPQQQRMIQLEEVDPESDVSGPLSPQGSTADVIQQLRQKRLETQRFLNSRNTGTTGRSSPQKTADVEDAAALAATASAAPMRRNTEAERQRALRQVRSRVDDHMSAEVMKRIRSHARDYVRQRTPGRRPNLNQQTRVDDHASPQIMHRLRSQHAQNDRNSKLQQKARVDTHASPESLRQPSSRGRDHRQGRDPKRRHDRHEEPRVQDHTGAAEKTYRGRTSSSRVGGKEQDRNRSRRSRK